MSSGERQSRTELARTLVAAGELPLSELEEEERAAGETPGEKWPAPFDAAALQGLAGDVVRTIEPHTEADPVAILVQFLIAAGNIVGPHVFTRVESDRHRANENAVIVGQTSKARKGTSWGHVRRLVVTAQAEFGPRIQSGLSSGEGLIHAVRDEREGLNKKGERILIDEGLKDKRLLVPEPEYAKVLRVAARDGSTLSATMRDAWDSGDLRILTKTAPDSATGAHISILGHVTADELLRYLNATECANGFANRFLFVCARRSKLLPEGGRLREEDLESLSSRLREVILWASEERELSRDDDARKLWAAVYPSLSAGCPGLVGAVTGRAEAHVLRLSLIYAVLDRAEAIRPDHLRAALAVWRYAEESAVVIFGDTLGDPIADELLSEIRARGEAGMTRTEVRDHFGRHQTDRVAAAVDLLKARRLIRVVDGETGGRPVERLFASLGRDRSDQSSPRPPLLSLSSPEKRT